jgi:hypothetical protein
MNRNIGIRIDIKPHVKEIPQAGLRKNEDPIHQNDRRRLNMLRLNGTGVGGEIVNRHLDGQMSITQLLEVSNQKVGLQ